MDTMKPEDRLSAWTDKVPDDPVAIRAWLNRMPEDRRAWQVPQRKQQANDVIAWPFIERRHLPIERRDQQFALPGARELRHLAGS